MRCIHSLVVEWLPSKESTRVQFPLDANDSIFTIQHTKNRIDELHKIPFLQQDTLYIQWPEWYLLKNSTLLKGYF